MISQDHLAKVRRYISLAQQTGQVELIRAHDQLSDKNMSGFYSDIAIATNVPQDSPCMTQEVFGPFVCITQFKEEEEAIRMANSTSYGLSATVWTNCVNRMHRVAHRLDVGTVWGNCWLVRNLNMPFGGVKSSGTGREGTQESREFYTNKKTVCLQIEQLI